MIWDGSRWIELYTNPFNADTRASLKLKFRTPSEGLNRYIYIDHANPVFDGGSFFLVDVDSFFIFATGATDQASEGDPE